MLYELTQKSSLNPPFLGSVWTKKGGLKVSLCCCHNAESLCEKGYSRVQSKFTEQDLWQQPFWISKVFSHLSWQCSSSISVLCSVTVFRNCWFVCVWQERQDCHLCGMTPNTQTSNLTPKSTFLSKLVCPFTTSLQVPVSHSWLQRPLSHLWMKKAVCIISQRGENPRLALSLKMHQRDIVLLSPHTM